MELCHHWLDCLLRHGAPSCLHEWNVTMLPVWRWPGRTMALRQVFLLRLKFEFGAAEWASLSAQPEQLCVHAASLFFDFCVLPTNSYELSMAPSRGVIAYHSAADIWDLWKSWDRSRRECPWIAVVNDVLSLDKECLAKLLSSYWHLVHSSRFP